jgi:predicted Fe-Mo cluster-binding NifX family protein
MKIAAISDDGKTISQHFGRASLYVVVTVEEGKIVSMETRAKSGHHTFAPHPDLAPGERHGYHADSPAKHKNMAETISDCQALLVGGMGWGAYESMKGYNIEPTVTDVESIDQAVQLYIAGELTNLTERLH